jgi:hypothetical protein
MLEETLLHYSVVRVFAGNLETCWSEALCVQVSILHWLMSAIAYDWVLKIAEAEIGQTGSHKAGGLFAFSF